MASPLFSVGHVVNSSSIFKLQDVSPILLDTSVSTVEKRFFDYVPFLSAFAKDIPDCSAPCHVPTLHVNDLHRSVKLDSTCM